MPEKCPKCGSTHLTQDPDTLDTWFSSALWPFSTLGWPEKTPEFDYFYPTDVLVTGYDIIFFWVIRMVFSGYEQTGKAPFHTVLIHGLVRDSQGRKMSKSLGNGIDPLEVIDKYGADALRLTLITGNAPGNDMRFYNERVEASRNFANKVWNASRFIMMNMEKNVVEEPEDFLLKPADRWILSKVNSLTKEMTENMDKFELGIAVQKVHDFIWDEFCDWYVEIAKYRIYHAEEDSQSANCALWVLKTVLGQALKLLHPFMPFVTEEIYQAIPHLEESICISKYPTVNPDFNDENINKQFTYLMDIVKGVREIRANYTIKNAIEVEYSIETKDEGLQELLDQCVPYLKKLCNATCVGYNQETSKDVATAMIQGGNTLIVELGAYVDKEAEKQKLQVELQKLEGEIKRCTNMLSNEKFVSKAPQAKVDSERQKLEDYTSKYNAVKEKLETM